MAVTVLVTTAGAANANAYISRLAADQFHLDKPPIGTTAATGLWSAATNDQKDAAILWATKLLDTLFVWNGYIAYTSQRLAWPRAGLYSVNSWEALDTTTIPDQIQWATAEYARQLLMSDRTADSDVETQGIKLIKAGSVRVDFKDSIHPKPVPDVVVNLIPSDWCYLRANEDRFLLRA